MSIPTDSESSAAPYTQMQGQYLVYIFYYKKLMGQAPAEVDMQKYFGVTPPSVHRMVVELERKGLLRRTAGKARSLELLLPFEALPPLR